MPERVSENPFSLITKFFISGLIISILLIMVNNIIRNRKYLNAKVLKDL